MLSLLCVLCITQLCLKTGFIKARQSFNLSGVLKTDGGGKMEDGWMEEEEAACQK